MDQEKPNRQGNESQEQTYGDRQCSQCGAAISGGHKYDGKLFCTSHCLREYKEERG